MRSGVKNEYDASIKEGEHMTYPDFFDKAPSITLRDPLADLLGAFNEGIITYTYLDAVKLAGHSCPTVAGAYLMALRGLKALYADEMPVRGSIEISMKGSRDEGVGGVIANVLGLITGAAGEEGFKGLKGLHARNTLLRFDPLQSLPLRMRRLDTDSSVALSYHPAAAQPQEIPRELMQAILTETAEREERQHFAVLWQENVKRILEHHDDPGLIVITRL